MQSQSELIRRNKSLTEINEKLSAKVLALESEINQLQLMTLLDKEFAMFMDKRNESSRKKDDYIQKLEAENQMLQQINADLDKEAKTWHSQAEKTAREYRLLEKEKEKLESRLSDMSSHYIDSVIGGVKEIDDYKKKYESLQKKYKNEVVSKVETTWMVNYAKKKPKTIEGAISIKDMLNDYYLGNEKMPQADVLSKLREINGISEAYDANHPQQPIVGAAAQVVVSNRGEVKYFNGEDNGKE